MGAGGTLTIAYAGSDAPRFTVRLTNTTTVPLWAALLDLTETYGIFTDAFPAGSVALGPGESTSVDLLGQVTDVMWEAGTASLRDQLMVVTSTLEFDPRSLEQEELDVSAVPDRRDHERRRRAPEPEVRTWSGPWAAPDPSSATEPRGGRGRRLAHGLGLRRHREATVTRRLDSGVDRAWAGMP